MVQGYTEAVDMWSAGVIIFILLAGYAPFDDDNDVMLYQKIKRGEHDMGDAVWDVISPEARDLVVGALSNNTVLLYVDMSYPAGPCLAQRWWGRP